MKKYYFLASILPPLQMGSPSDMSFSELMFLCDVNMRHKDKEKVEVIRRFFDLQNLRLLWEKEHLDENIDEDLDRHGNLDENGLEDALLTGDGLPSYVYNYLDHYENVPERLRNFHRLIANYFRYEIPSTTGFVHDYLIFEHDWRLVFAALRAKQLGRDITHELQYEDLDSPLVRQILSQKDAPVYEPPEGFEQLKEIFQTYQADPLSLFQAFCEFRFNTIEERLGTDMFSLNRVLGYIIQLILVEKWIELDKQKGLKIVDNIVKEAK